jgi:hypothetical protein
VWGDADLARYLQNVYLRRLPVPEEPYGTQGLLGATWHFGMASDCVRGHGPSQQPPEQAHAEFKHGVQSVDDGATVMEVGEQGSQYAITVQ